MKVYYYLSSTAQYQTPLSVVLTGSAKILCEVICHNRNCSKDMRLIDDNLIIASYILVCANVYWLGYARL